MVGKFWVPQVWFINLGLGFSNYFPARSAKHETGDEFGRVAAHYFRKRLKVAHPLLLCFSQGVGLPFTSRFVFIDLARPFYFLVLAF
jgi:hypothetical protein